jgi:hypothetical protein
MVGLVHRKKQRPLKASASLSHTQARPTPRPADAASLRYAALLTQTVSPLVVLTMERESPRLTLKGETSDGTIRLADKRRCSHSSLLLCQ